MSVEAAHVIRTEVALNALAVKLPGEDGGHVSTNAGVVTEMGGLEAAETFEALSMAATAYVYVVPLASPFAAVSVNVVAVPLVCAT